MGNREPKIVSETEDFRIYERETFHRPDGTMVVMHKCEEIVAGRWEPFYSIVLIRNADGSIRFSRLGRTFKAIDTKPTDN